MIMDKELEFSDAQAVTAAAISANVYDTGETPVLKDIGAGEPLELVIVCTETVTSGGASTVAFSLESDSTVDLATSATVHQLTAAIAKATLVAGYEVARFRLPKDDYERYLGVRYAVAVADLTAGKFDAFIVHGSQDLKSLPDAI